MTELERLKNEVEEYKKIQIIFQNKIKRLQQICEHNKYRKVVSTVIPPMVAYICTYCDHPFICEGEDKNFEKKLESK